MSLEDVHLQRILEHIGPYPPNLVEACNRRADFFDEQGEIMHLNLPASPSGS
jgi:serine/threonine-protein kinase SRPK3